MILVPYFASLYQIAWSPKSQYLAICFSLSSLSTGTIAFIGATIGSIGLQKESMAQLRLFRLLKIVQVMLTVLSNVIILVNLFDISEEITESVISEYHLEQRRAEIQRIVHQMLKGFSIASIIFCLAFQTHAAFVAHRIINTLERGLDLDPRQLVLMVPLNVRPDYRQARIECQTPVLHGQVAVIPVAFS